VSDEESSCPWQPNTEQALDSSQGLAEMAWEGFMLPLTQNYFFEEP
jgi:hypothetical protein